MEKKIVPSTEHGGTPVGDVKMGDLEFPMETNWQRLDRYEANLERATSWIPKEVSSLLRSIE